LVVSAAGHLGIPIFHAECFALSLSLIFLHTQPLPFFCAFLFSDTPVRLFGSPNCPAGEANGVHKAVTMIRRNARLRKEYLYRKGLEGKEKAAYERKRQIRTALEGG
jgi:hypothetical protein